MPIESSAHRVQPKVVAASTESTGTPGGSTRPRYASGWASNRSQDGRETTLAGDAVIGEPLGRLDAHGDLAAGADEHDPRVGDRTDGGPAALDGRAVRHHGDALAAEDQRRRARRAPPPPARPAAVSLASAGRMSWRPGMARSAARCSTGWWVGPSSPTPTESWLNTKTACGLAHGGQAQAGAGRSR